MTSGIRGRRARSAAMVLAAAVQACAHTAPPKRVNIDISGMAFSPAHVAVAAGDTVVWTNHDIVPHTATVPSGFDSGTLNQGASARLVVTQAGTTSYSCTFHPTMKGEIVAR